MYACGGGSWKPTFRYSPAISNRVFQPDGSKATIAAETVSVSLSRVGLFITGVHPRTNRVTDLFAAIVNCSSMSQGMNVEHTAEGKNVWRSSAGMSRFYSPSYEIHQRGRFALHWPNLMFTDIAIPVFLTERNLQLWIRLEYLIIHLLLFSEIVTLFRGFVKFVPSFSKLSR